jgi:hypothetical protein
MTIFERQQLLFGPSLYQRRLAESLAAFETAQNLGFEFQLLG